MEKRLVAHLDMDAFFASVESRMRGLPPEIPLCVGGTVRGVVSSANYAMRAFGVKSGMPTSQAVSLCPEGVFVPVRMWLYARVSGCVLEALRHYSPDVSRRSIDEASLEVTDLASAHGGAAAVATLLREAVSRRVGVSCSIGVAPNALLAKMASEVGKPGGGHAVLPGHERAFLLSRRLPDIPGFGASALRALAAHGVGDMRGLLGLDVREMGILLGERGVRLYGQLRGRWSQDDGRVRGRTTGCEDTLDADVADRDALAGWVVAQSMHVARELEEQDALAGAVVVKMRYDDFSAITRRARLPVPTRTPAVIAACARKVLESMPMPRAVRLIGVTAVHAMQACGMLPLESMHALAPLCGEELRAMLCPGSLEDMRGSC